MKLSLAFIEKKKTIEGILFMLSKKQ